MPDTRLNAEQVHLVKTHHKLAVSIAEAFWHRSNETLDFTEMLSVAYLGLTTAASRFDPEWRPPADPSYQPFLAFGSYAKKRITGAILDWQRTQDHVPRRQRQTYKKLQEHGHGSGRSPEELSDLTGLSADKIRAIVFAVEATAVSLDDTWENKESESIEHVESSVLVTSINRMMADAVRSFPPLQRSIIVQRYYLGHELSAIAAELGVSVSTVRVLHHESMVVLNFVFRDAAHT